MKQYWAVIGGKMQGPFEIPELVTLPGFDANVSVFISGQDEWKQAVQFPAISRYLRTGELPEELQVGDEHIKILPQNWREAIVHTDVALPDIKVSPTPLEISTARSTIKEAIHSTREATGKVAHVSNWATRTRQGQKVVLLLLGLGLFRTYQPAVEFLPNILNQMTAPDPAMISPKPHKARIPWHRLRNAIAMHARAAASVARTAPAAAAVPALKPNEPKVVETDSSPLPDGMVMKTVTTVTEINGAKVYKTRTFVESPNAKKKHK